MKTPEQITTEINRMKLHLAGEPVKPFGVIDQFHAAIKALEWVLATGPVKKINLLNHYKE